MEVDLADAPPPSARLKDLEKEDDGMDEEQRQRSEMEKSFWTKLWQGMAMASGGLAIAAIVLEGSGVCIAAGVVALAVAVVVFKFQLALEDTDSLRKVQNQLRADINRLQQENNVLDSEVTKLGTVVKGLQGTEAKLEGIVAEQGSNVSSLVALVKENGEIIAAMDSATRAETLHGLFDIVLRADTDRSFTIGTHEISLLMLRFQVDPRVTVQKSVLTQKVKEAGGELPLSKLVEDLVTPAERVEDRVFVFKSHHVKQ